MADRKRVVIIGLGGIGGALVEPLCRFLNFDEKNEWQVVLVDGDVYEERNATRQSFGQHGFGWFVEATKPFLEQSEDGRELLTQATEQVLGFGNKAEVTASRIGAQFPNLLVTAVPAFVAGAEDNVTEAFRGMIVPVAELIRDGDTVFLAVDNHKTRLTVSQQCQTLPNVRLISGGNDIVHGNVQVYVRRAGRDLFQPLEAVHSEIAEAATAKAPHEMSCEELAVSGTPQVLFANMSAATFMLNLFWAELKRSNRAGEIYFSIEAFGTAVGPAAVPFTRAPTGHKS